MTTVEAIRQAMAERRITQTKLAELIGYKSQSGLASRLSNGNILSETLIEILDKLDYEVVVQPKTAGKRKEGAIVLEPSNVDDRRRRRQNGT